MKVEAKTHRPLEAILKDYQQWAFQIGDRTLKIRVFKEEIEAWTKEVDKLDKEHAEAKAYWEKAKESTDAPNH